MGLNDIQLPGSLLTNLYPSSLVLTGLTEAPVAAVTEVQETKQVPAVKKSGQGDWKFLGNNQKNILIVVDYKEVVHLPDEALGFLTAMLAACKLDLGDVAIINRQHHPDLSSNEFLSRFSSKVVFLFGIEPAVFGLPVSFPQFQVQSVAGTTFLYTPSLEECKEDKLVKSKLWVCLQRIFSI